MLTIIMAGGKGTRISELFPDIPKPLIPIDNIPVLEREINSLRNQGFTNCLVYNKNTQNCRGDSPKLQKEIPQ